MSIGWWKHDVVGMSSWNWGSLDQIVQKSPMVMNRDFIISGRHIGCQRNVEQAIADL